MTEDEARTKWCPMWSDGNRPAIGEYTTKCIASACMMWRFADFPKEGQIAAKHVPAHGYCGLAGKD